MFLVTSKGLPALVTGVMKENKQSSRKNTPTMPILRMAAWNYWFPKFLKCNH